MITRVKGTQDFLDLTLYNFIVNQTKKQLKEYYFSEIKIPVLEPLALFTRSLGTYTDVVMKEMFIIEPRDEEQERICLRPEATASIVRAFIENGIQQIPWKVFTHGPMFRYERPQKGRFREFHQINIEVIGSNSLFYDAHFIKMLDRLFHEKMLLNNYALLLNFLGCLHDRAEYRNILYQFLESNRAQNVCETCKIRKEKNIMRIFDCKNPQCQEIYTHAPKTAEHLCKECTQEWHILQEQLALLSVSFAYKPTLVRGLDYYSKTVFEFVSMNLGAQNAFCGGGRYDQLVTQLGGKADQPSIGAAMGIERLITLCELYKEQLLLPSPPPLYMVMPLSHEQYSLALLITDMLQAHGLCTEVFVEGDSLKSMMRHAHKMGAKYTLLLGEEEQRTKTATLKNMITGTQETIPQRNIIEYLKK